jgi:transcriptional regulator with XRE-family HTH domain
VAEISLTTKERATLLRRRQGMTVKEVADKVGCHRNTLHRRENDGEVSYGTIEATPLELAYIKRKRLGMTQLECALLMGISRFWFNQMEQGNVPHAQLLKFWEN